jgi:DNA polymerase-4/DNA polymerase V
VKLPSETSERAQLPRAIMHVDGDSFFVSCELTRKPGLRGKPVVTGLERGIASAMSPEAKKAGIHRGMRLREMRRVCPEVTILPSDYDMYVRYAHRMYNIVRRYTDVVEEYSIDECFADLTDCPLSKPSGGGLSYEEIARRIQADLRDSLGITFSLGLSVNKVMAKVASKWNKPNGFTVIGRDTISLYLKDLPVGKIWGIGSSTMLYLKKLGIVTALDLALKDHVWINEHCDLPVARISAELRGNQVMELSTDAHADYASVQRTRTFKPPSASREFCWSQLSHHVEDACMRLRLDRRTATKVSFFLKTQGFEYIGEEVSLPEATAEPQEVLRALRPRFDALFVNALVYRATGVTMFGLRSREVHTVSLFGQSSTLEKASVVTQTVDALAHKFGRNMVFLGSSLRAHAHDMREDARNQKGQSATSPRGVNRKHFELIFLGEVR